jgi:hypothetical protein
LGLLPGPWTPTLHERVVRLGASVPFAEVPELVALFTQVAVSAATVRRLTEGAGAAYVALQTAEVEHLERTWPEPTAETAVQRVSVDGAQVPLVKGGWGEVKTLAVGVVGRDEIGGVQTTDLSYFSRRAEAAEFTRLASVEVARRAVERAVVVAGVVDGAEWCQGFLDAHCPHAVRILDFPHAVGHLARAAQAVLGTVTEAIIEWLAARLKELTAGHPAAVLVALWDLPVGKDTEAAAARAEVAGYVAARLEQMRYAAFVAAGLPIGSGAVESANKLVVEARLKGAGMRWAPEHVNPMVALRTVACGKRWGGEWPRIAARLQARGRRSQPRAVAPSPPAPPPPEPATVGATLPGGRDPMPPPSPLPPAAPTRPKLIANGKPTAHHPCKRFPAVTPRANVPQ